MLVCPKCGSNYLTVRQRVGFEEIMMRFTAKRKYKCMGCHTSFRAPDRRKVPRGKADSSNVGQAFPPAQASNAPPSSTEPAPNAEILTAPDVGGVPRAPKEPERAAEKREPLPKADILATPSAPPAKPAPKAARPIPNTDAATGAAESERAARKAEPTPLSNTAATTGAAPAKPAPGADAAINALPAQPTPKEPPRAPAKAEPMPAPIAQPIPNPDAATSAAEPERAAGKAEPTPAPTEASLLLAHKAKAARAFLTRGRR